MIGGGEFPAPCVFRALAVRPGRVIVANALIVGGTRFVGLAVAKHLLSHGWEVSVLHRGRTPARFPGPLRETIGDRRDAGTLSLALARGADLVVDTCGYEATDLAPLLPLLAGAAGRYVFVSTVSVYSDMNEFPTGEDHPYFQGDPAKNLYAAYAAGKVACERLLRESPLPFTILRPAFVYGPWNTLYREAYYFDLLSRGGAVTAGETGAFLTQLGHVEDLAEAVGACAAQPNAAGGIYNVTGPAMTQARVLQTLLDAAAPGKRLEEGPAPRSPWGIRRHLCVSTARLERDTGWTSAISLEEGFRGTFAWYRTHAGERRTLWDEGASRSGPAR